MGEKKEKSGFSKYLGLTFLIGCGFFTMGLMDPLYDTYVPIFLRRYINSNALVGAIMTLDNVLQLFLIPVIAVWSDRTRTKIGRRMPFIVVMLPISAVLFHFIPVMAASSLWALILILFCFNIFKTSIRGPIVALMPDTIPADYRSEANGVINTMGGVGTIIGTLVLAQLMRIKEGLPFTITAVCIFAAVLILLFFVHERTPDPSEEAEEHVPVLKAIKMVFTSRNAGGKKDYSLLLILVSLLFWFMAEQGAKPFLGLYMVDVLGVSASNAALAQGVAGVAGVLCAVLSGYLAHKVGRRRYIRICLVVLALILFLIPVVSNLGIKFGLGGNVMLILLLALMFIYGAFWVGVTVNSFPMIWQMATFGNVGIYTGLYYTFSQSAAILAPPIAGLIIDLAGYNGIFIFGGVCMAIAWCTMGGVRRGEASDSST
ncbi:MFS transporter [Spirochaetia bacterium]|nr:MFS transporter [Spirochaetia bacterium]